MLASTILIERQANHGATLRPTEAPHSRHGRRTNFMKLPPTILAVLSFVVITATSAFGQNPVDYTTAFQRAQAGDKPLLVLVTATWCPPCQVMKNTTIPELMRKDAFKNCHWATVDFDAENDIAMQLTDGKGVPQLLMFEKRDGKWTRRKLAGYKNAPTVEAFVAQSEQLRMAKLTEVKDTNQQKQ